MKILGFLLGLMLLATTVAAKCYTTNVNERGLDGWTIYFYPGDNAEVTVSGDGDTDLDCTVLDQSNETMLVDNRNDPDCNLEWYTRYGGYFTIGVLNRGRVYNHYSLCTNGSRVHATEIR